MNLKMYLYPNYVSLSSAAGRAPAFFKFLKKQEIELEAEYWDGTLGSIPSGEPAIIRGSSVMDCKWPALAQRCEELGHFLFYDDRRTHADGSKTDDLLEATAAFLDKVRSRQTKDTVIPYLKSRPKDQSTLGSGNHTRRQAGRLLKLFGEHVLQNCKPNSSAPSVFDQPYTVVQIGKINEGGVAGELGYDSEGVNRLRDELKTDVQALNAMDVTPLSDDPRAKQYCYKLRQGLAANLEALREATSMVEAMYAAHTNPVLGIIMGAKSASPLGLFVGTFGARRNTDATGKGVRMLYEMMLPLLIEKLLAAGYPDSDKVLEWDYGEPDRAQGMSLLAAAAPLMGASIGMGISRGAKAICLKCNHQVQFEVYQALEVDGKTPKGDPELRGLPDACPQCGNVINKPSVDVKKGN